MFAGGGGTQRLPKVAGVPNSLDLCLTGKTLKADKAKKFGIVDLLVDPLGPGLDTPENSTRKYLETIAIDVAKQIASGKLSTEKKKGLTEKVFNAALQYDFVKDQIFKKAKAQVMKMSGGLYPAPLKVGYIQIDFGIYDDFGLISRSWMLSELD